MPIHALSEADFETIDSVPIFTEHEDFDAEKLARVVAVNNARFDAGEPATIIVGHTDDTDNEKPALGFIDRLTLGIRNGLATIFARFRIYRDQVQELRKYPKRSIEIYEDDLTIPAIALLGGNAPRLDLGVLYERTKKKLIRYSLNTFNEVSDMTPEEIKQLVQELLESSDVFAWAKAKMAAEANEADQPGEEPEPEANADDEEQDDEKDKDENKKYRRVTAQYKRLQSEHDQLWKRFHLAERRNDLMQLQSDGYDFDIDSELEDVADLTDPQFTKHVERIQTRYRKAPVGISRTLFPSKTNGRPSIEEIKNIENEAVKSGRSFREVFNTYK